MLNFIKMREEEIVNIFDLISEMRLVLDKESDRGVCLLSVLFLEN